MGRADDHGMLKAEWVHVLRQLEGQLKNMEGERWASARGHEEVKKELQRLKAEAAQFEAQRVKETTELRQDLRNQRGALANVTTMVNMVRRGLDSGDSLREELEGLEQMMLDFKRTRRLEHEELNNEERLLSRELEVLAKHFDSWDLQAPSVPSRKALVANPASGRGESIVGQEEEDLGEQPEHEEETNESAQPGETLEKLEARVQALNHRIARAGGTTGGWHIREHDIFVTIMAQTGTGEIEAPAAALEELVDRTMAVLRERSETEVLEHRHWYMCYQGLVEEKRLAVKHWRALRDDVKAQEKKRTEKAGEEATRMLKASSTKCLDEEKRREEQRKKVEGWREEKARKAREEEEAKLAKEEEDRRAEEDRRRRKSARMRQEVELYRFEKEREKQRTAEVERLLQADKGGSTQASPRGVVVDLESRVKETLEQARHKREAIAKKDLSRRIQEREEKQKKLLESLRESPREEGQPQLVPRHVYRDPERLVKPTHASQVWKLSDKQLDDMEEQRVKAGAHERPMAGMGRDLQFVGRAVPEWRRTVVGLL